MASARKRLNPWNLVFEKFNFSQTDDTINALKENSDTFLDAHARENGLLDHPFAFQ